MLPAVGQGKDCLQRKQQRGRERQGEQTRAGTGTQGPRQPRRPFPARRGETRAEDESAAEGERQERKRRFSGQQLQPEREAQGDSGAKSARRPLARATSRKAAAHQGSQDAAAEEFMNAEP